MQSQKSKRKINTTTPLPLKNTWKPSCHYLTAYIIFQKEWAAAYKSANLLILVLFRTDSNLFEECSVKCNGIYLHVLGKNFNHLGGESHSLCLVVHYERKIFLCNIYPNSRIILKSFNFKLHMIYIAKIQSNLPVSGSFEYRLHFIGFIIKSCPTSEK